MAYLGLSAETGELSDNHDIVSLKTQNLYSISGSPPPTNRGPSSGNRDRSNTKKQDSKSSSSGGGSWLWFLFKVVLFFAVVAGGYVGWTAYRAKQRYSRF